MDIEDRRHKVLDKKLARLARRRPEAAGYQFCPQCAAPLEPGLVDGESRSLCTLRCGFVHWNNPIPVVLAIVEHEGRIILARQPGWPADSFFLIGGFVEQAENLETAILREIDEELGLQAKILDRIGSYAFPEMNQVLTVYHTESAGPVTLGPELEEIKYVEPDRLMWWSRGAGPAVRDWIIARVGQF